MRDKKQLVDFFTTLAWMMTPVRADKIRDAESQTLPCGFAWMRPVAEMIDSHEGAAR